MKYHFIFLFFAGAFLQAAEEIIVFVIPTKAGIHNPGKSPNSIDHGRF